MRIQFDVGDTFVVKEKEGLYRGYMQVSYIHAIPITLYCKTVQGANEELERENRRGF